MSYCRFSDGDVYAYDTDGGVQFWVARPVGESLDRLCGTYDEAYRYAVSLRDEHGIDVPECAIEALAAEAGIRVGLDARDPMTCGAAEGGTA